jgi:hypothetical protein
MVPTQLADLLSVVGLFVFRLAAPLVVTWLLGRALQRLVPSPP